MATITFHAADQGLLTINALAGSGIGFYGSGFGASVAVGAYQDTTFITDSNGTVNGAQVNNVKWQANNSGEVNGATAIDLLDVPNYLASLQPRFTHTSAVQVQNVKFRQYNRTNINTGGSGVTLKAAELIHTSSTQTGSLGSGDAVWTTPAGSAVIMDMAQSPGMSGVYAKEGTSSVHASTRHDWYLALSASPNSVGSKLFAGYVELEFL